MELEYENYDVSTSLLINSGDRNLESESTFEYTIDFGHKSKGCSVNKVFKNIKSIKVENVIIPNFYIDLQNIHALVDNDMIKFNHNETIDESYYLKFKKISDLPYIVLKITDINKNNIGTNNTFNESFSILRNDNSIVSNTGMTLNYTVDSSQKVVIKDNYGKKLLPCDGTKIIQFRNMSNEKSYSDSVKGILNDLKISFHYPSGELIEFMKDKINISSCSYYDATVRVASTSNLGLSPGGTVDVDGERLVTNDLVLLKNQTTTTENGVYIYDGTDFTSIDQSYKSYKVLQGTTNINKVFRYIGNAFRRDETLKIKSSEFFSSEEYKIGDTIKVKKLSANGTSDNGLNTHLLNEKGHTIVDLFDSTGNSNSMYDTLVIPLKTTVKFSTGNIEYHNTFVTNSFNYNDTNSYLINSDLQHLININIVNEKYIQKFKSKLI